MKIKVREIVKSRGFTIRELSDRIYVSERAICDWMTGKKYPNFENTRRLCELLECGIEDLYEI